MLIECHIRHFTIIEQCELHIANGMTVLTGETGAGKSILVDALGLVLGNRADSKWIRKGHQSAEVCATFRLLPETAAHQWLLQNDLPLEDDSCIIRRVINVNGPSKSYLNGRPVTVQQLRELGQHLVLIHGQHEHHALLKATYQRERLDHFAHHDALVAKVAKDHHSWQQACDRLEVLQSQHTQSQAQQSLLEYQVNELTNLDLIENEVSQLHQEQQQLRHVETLISASGNALTQLEDDDSSIATQLHHTMRELQNISTMDERVVNVINTLEQAGINLNEAVHDLRHYHEHLSTDPERLNTVESRLNSLHDMARKHQVPAEQLYEHYQSLQTQLASLKQSDDDIEALREECIALQQQWQTSAEKLTTSRKKSADTLSRKVTKAMQELGMDGGKFAAVLTAHSDGQPRSHGQESVSFTVSTNPGQPHGGLAEVASGGELSRISLSIQVLTAATQPTPTLIFDEVDVGIGGATAEVVGKLLRQLGQHCQVLCVTHLPQVASQARHHLQVTKQKTTDSTSSQVVGLDQEARINELARMLGGVDITEQTRQHAASLLVDGA